MSPDPRKPRCDSSDGADDCPSPPPSSDSRGRLVTAFVVSVSVLVLLSLVSLSIYCLVRRRRRRRQQSLLAVEAATANPGVQGGAAAPDVEGGGPEDEGDGDDVEVVHHAWHIRTVGLDEATIESIALTRYRAGAGMLGAADCSVCLGEFRDGELLRLLPKCGHGFHVPCIGTWLRAHVNCPLCRADVVLDPAAAAAGDSDPSAGANADTDVEQAFNNTETLGHEQPCPGQQQNEQHEVRVRMDQPSPEPQRRQPDLRVQNFRRVASMNSSIVIVSAGEAPEDEQSSKESQGNGVAACCKASSGSGRLYHMKRSFSGGGRRSPGPWHCRTRSSVLPS